MALNSRFLMEESARFLSLLVSIMIGIVIPGTVVVSDEAHAVAATIYVDSTTGNDSGPGTAENPFKTIQKALQIVQPGCVIRLAVGTYEEANETVRTGNPATPIIIEPQDATTRPILDGRGNTLNALRIVHSYYIVRGLEIRNSREGVRIEGATGVILENNLIHHVNSEAVRLRRFATGNTVRKNTIWKTGLVGNGEGVYIGTAPEQRDRNGGQPDASTNNLIEGNEIYDVTEGIDIKEDSSFNMVRGNVIHDSTDPNSGGINVRADENYFYGNLSYNNAGAGYRFGGDVAYSPVYGESYHYGVRNVLRDNIARNNAYCGYKFMNGPQDADYSNTGTDTGILYYYGPGVEPCVSGGDAIADITSPVPKEPISDLIPDPTPVAPLVPAPLPALETGPVESPAPSPAQEEPPVPATASAPEQPASPAQEPQPAVFDRVAPGFIVWLGAALIIGGLVLSLFLRMRHI